MQYIRLKLALSDREIFVNPAQIAWLTVAAKPDQTHVRFSAAEDDFLLIQGSPGDIMRQIRLECA